VEHKHRLLLNQSVSSQQSANMGELPLLAFVAACFYRLHNVNADQKLSEHLFGVRNCEMTVI